MNTKKRYWIGFNLVKGIGPARLRRLLNYFGDVEVAWNASRFDLRAAGLGEALVQKITDVRNSVDLERVMANARAKGIDILTWDDDGYPEKLLEIDSPPPVLYVRGTLKDTDAWAVAIVGTRRATRYGRQMAHDLGAFLAQNGVTVVSGLARGVDAIAHQAALNAGGRTLAVLGSGVDKIYPPENKGLALELSEQGALISDYAPGTPPDGSNFPPRNRIISGLSLAIVVVEAGKSSGALITARFAADQGREVFALPGHITSPMSVGPNRLIQDGAIPLLHPEDILDMLNLARVTAFKHAKKLLPENPIEAQLMGAIGMDPVHIDDICAALKMKVEQISPNLTMMELKGLVRQVGGMYYVTVRDAASAYSISSEN